ncbi:HlyC/CorC family transporter [Thalassobaculum sp. OXR-137]|uniref:HlyC/CorC family transporter n=1 Tax=Thalassobaculum sp. OXR-137 TaxID=3100173 RepID=UPI002AC9BFFE|nr:HlyC/CorC family transporter [Thalassobaculum sp. OXR-137]WPZ34800.1 HlyC/CorC family transporter [Thalassobaculum sp. OXR-137]
MDFLTTIEIDVETAITLGVIFFLILMSGFFSGSETALTAASKARLSQLARKGSTRAATVVELKEKSDSLIGAILIGNNIANILASALATSAMIALMGENGVAIATVVMTVLVVIFAEVLPKTYAINNPDKMALVVGPLIRALVFVLTPFTWATRVIVGATLKLFGVSVAAGLGHDEREEELRGLIEMHADGGQEVEHERAMLRSILDLADVEVEEIMTHRGSVRMIDADAPIDELLAQVLESPFTRLPLYREDQDNIVGVLHVKALLRAIRAAKGMTPEAFDVMAIAAEPWFIPDTTTLLDQLQAFRERREHFAVVVDEYGSFMGVVTLEDILEEIVGDILDEHDVAVSGVRPQPDGSFVVEGSVTIRDLNREFEWNLPDEEASTIAGLVLYEARKIPEVGQEFSFHGFRFRILRRHRNQMTLLRMTPITQPASS